MGIESAKLRFLEARRQFMTGANTAASKMVIHLSSQAYRDGILDVIREYCGAVVPLTFGDESATFAMDVSPELGAFLITDATHIDSLLGSSPGWASVGPIGQYDAVLLVHEDSVDECGGLEIINRFRSILACVSGVSSQTVRALKSVRRAQADSGLPFFLDEVVKSRSFVLRESAERVKFRDRLHAFVISLQDTVGRSLYMNANDAITVQEELLMNAIWDANPAWRDSQDRRQECRLQDEREVGIEWGFDGRLLGIAITDPYGTFPPQIIGRYLEYFVLPRRNKKVDISWDGRGAGLGLYSVLQKVTQLSVATWPGHKTEVIATFDLTKRPRDVIRAPRSLQFSFLP